MKVPAPDSAGAIRQRIFVIEDYPDTAEIVSTLLATLGHDCRFAITGADALAEIPRHDPDVVFSELVLPDLDGCELAQHLRRQARRPYLVALTSWAGERELARARAAGFDEY